MLRAIRITYDVCDTPLALRKVLHKRPAGSRAKANDGEVSILEEGYSISHVLHKTKWRIEGNDGVAEIIGFNPSTLPGRMRKDGIRRP